MNIIISTLLVIASIISLLLVIAFFTKRGYNINCEIIIDAPRQKVFDYLKMLKNHDNFKTNSRIDLDRKTEFKGTDGTVGFVYSWNGNKNVGEGEHEIKAIEEGRSIETEIRFVRPFVVVGHTKFITEFLSDYQTKVSLNNASNLKYPINFLLLFVEKNITKDMHESLKILKNILEK